MIDFDFGPDLGDALEGIGMLIRNKYIGGTLAAALLLAAVHYGADYALYHDDFKSLTSTFAEKAAHVCGHGDSDRMVRISRNVRDDLAKHRSLMTWLPNKSAADQLRLAEEFNLTLYPVTWGQGLVTFDHGVDAVLFAHGGEDGQPVLAYRKLERAQFGTLMEAMEQKGGRVAGDMVVRWNPIDRHYDFVDIPPGAARVSVGGRDYDTVLLKANPCALKDGALHTGKAYLKQTLRALIPGS